MVHPSAIVHPKAQLGTQCEIGPYCIIGADVMLGDECKLHSHVVIEGHTTLGKQNEIYPFTSIGLRTQDLKYKGGVTRTQIGDANTIREGVTINSATGDGEVTVIGSRNSILAGSHLGHNVRLGDHVVVSMAGIAGHVLIEDYAVIGGMAGVHQFCRIGQMAMVAGCARIVQDVAPFMLVEGHPAGTRTVNKVAMERNGISESTQNAVKQAFRIIFREGLTLATALAKVEQEVPACPEVQHLVAFIRASERGITK